jgi:ferric-dicitrate binding protein FerR (iron transport regulator)
MPENRINEIIARVLNGSSTLLDLKELKQWRTESPENELRFNSLKKYWETKSPRETTENEKIRIEALLKYSRESLVPGKSKPIHLSLPAAKIFRYAASIALLLGFGFLGGLLFTNPPASLKTSEISVSRGSRANVTLPDGSIVWLGHESRLSYPEKFSGSTREVTLSGEAYFDVESDLEHPFLVHTSGPTIRVTGTEFYVHDYPGDPSMEASLISGKIDLLMKDRLLSKMQPGTKLIYTKETGKLIAGSFESAYYEFWKKGEYSFVDRPFGELASMMKRIYNVEIIFRNDGLKEKRFTGSLGSDDNVYTLLEIFKKSSSTNFSYSIDHNKIYVTAKK